MYKETHNPSAAGQSLLNRCAEWRKALLSARNKPDFNDEGQVALYISAARRIQAMDAKELFEAYTALIANR